MWCSSPIPTHPPRAAPRARLTVALPPPLPLMRVWRSPPPCCQPHTPIPTPTPASECAPKPALMAIIPPDHARGPPAWAFHPTTCSGKGHLHPATCNGKGNQFASMHQCKAASTGCYPLTQIINPPPPREPRIGISHACMQGHLHEVACNVCVPSDPDHARGPSADALARPGRAVGPLWCVSRGGLGFRGAWGLGVSGFRV